MTDFYRKGFDRGYGKREYGPREYPQNDGDAYSYERGIEDGQRRRRISEELDRDGY